MSDITALNLKSKPITREQFAQLESNITHIRELRAKQDKLLGELVLALAYQHLWPGWCEAKIRSAGLNHVPGTGTVPRPHLWTRRDPGTIAVYRMRMELVMTADGEDRRFPANDIPDVLWEHLLREYRRRD